MRVPLSSLLTRFWGARIVTKLALIAALLLAITAVVGGLSYSALARVNRSAASLAEVWLPSVGELTAARADMLVARDFEVKHTHAADDGYRSEYEEKMNAALASAAQHLKDFKSRDEAVGDGKLLADFEKSWAEYLKFNSKIIALSRSGKAQDAQDISDGAGKSSHDDALGSLERLTNAAFAEGKAAGSHSQAVYRTAAIGILATLAVALVVGGLLTYTITRSITRPIREAVRVARGVADGDLNMTFDASGSNETGQLLSALKSMQGVLRDNEAEARNAKGQISAIHKAQAVVEFDLEGRILAANENFLSATGYALADVKGQHHRMFVRPADHASPGYKALWEKLARGEYDAGTYQRVARDGRTLWLQASYNPILGADGKPYKVVKYASDVTEQVKMKEALDAAVNEAQAIVESAVAGELTRRIATEGKTGQIESLAKSVNALIDIMMSVVSEIKSAAVAVQASAQDISHGNVNLSQRTEEQASSLEETASSMEEMTSTVKATADNAAQARQLAVAAREQAERGGQVVQAAVAAMSGINAASRKIADIIGVIDEIAFQTNLLALNAAVEAARAGDQGRGFAVVAAEVRVLASRSAEAAKEIKALISDSVAKVDQGSKLVDQSGQSLGDISTAVKRVTDVVAEIAEASQEQASGIEQVNKAVMQMDGTTQQNAALVAEASAASEAIVKHATELAGLVERYRVGAEPSAAGAAAARAPDARGVAAERAAPAGSRASEVAASGERRGRNRPWSGRPAAEAQPSPPPVARAAGAADDWTDF